MSFKRNTLVALFTAGVAYAAMYPEQEARAAWVRDSAASCGFNSPSDSNIGGGVHFGSAVATGAHSTAQCPFRERDGLQRDDLTTFTIFVRDDANYGEVRVSVCKINYDATSASCGGAEFTGDAATPGYVAWDIGDLDMSAWNSTLGTAYIFVNVSAFTATYNGYYAVAP